MKKTTKTASFFVLLAFVFTLSACDDSCQFVPLSNGMLYVNDGCNTLNFLESLGL